MKRGAFIFLAFFLLAMPLISAPEVEETTSDLVINSITLKASGEEIEWETIGYSKNGFKVTWSKNENPTYPLREGDKYNYFSNPKTSNDKLTAFDGAGTYYVRVCEYLGGKCGVYSNEIEVTLGEEKEKLYGKEDSKEEILKEKVYTKEKQVEKLTSLCNGCLSDEICYPLGHRTNGTFCNNNFNLTVQLVEKSPCENNFECDSNVCISGECMSNGLIRKIINWFTKFFN